MGNFDYKNICVQIKVRENLTDPRLVEFTKNWNFTRTDFFTFLNPIWGKTDNKHAKKIVEFFVKYKNGIILPDKCDTAEPIRETFDKNNISSPVAWLSFPGGELCLRKKYKFDVDIENEYWSIIWSDGKIVKPVRTLPEYMGIITFWFSKQRKIDMDFLKQLLKDFCEYLNTDYGVIFDQETHEVIFNLFEKKK
ncbi:hypothetical protein [Coprobacter sp.]